MVRATHKMALLIIREPEYRVSSVYRRPVPCAIRPRPRVATRPNETWAMDFVHDQLATGRKLRVLTIADTFSRFSPALEPRFSFRGTDVMSSKCWKEPARNRIAGSDLAGTKAPSSCWWCWVVGVSAWRDARGKPTDRQCLHCSFDGRFRAECLNALQMRARTERSTARRRLGCY